MGGRAAASWDEKWKSVEHGTTYGMAQRCYKLNPTGSICEACKVIRNDYVSRWRSASPTVKAKARSREGARAKALVRLARTFPTEFQRLLNEEVAKLYARELKQLKINTAKT